METGPIVSTNTPISSIWNGISTCVRNIKSAFGFHDQGLSRVDNTRHTPCNIPPANHQTTRMELNSTGSRFAKLRDLNEISGLEQLCESQNRAEEPTSVIQRCACELQPKKYYPTLGCEVDSTNGSGACLEKNDLHGVTAMARSTNRSTEDREPQVTASMGHNASQGLAEPRKLSLEEVLISYERPINEEEAWAVCYQCCSWLRVSHPQAVKVSCVKDPSSILLQWDGTVSLQHEPRHDDDTDGSPLPPTAECQLVQSLGLAIYRALDCGIDDSEEQVLSPHLENLIERMTVGDQSDEGYSPTGNVTMHESYSRQEEEKEEEEDQDGTIRPVCTFRQVMAACASRLVSPSLAPERYRDICRALFVKTMALQAFRTMIRGRKKTLKKISPEETAEDKSTDVDALKHTPPRVKTDVHELSMELIRSRPPLKPVSEHRLPPPPPQQLCLHDRLMADIRQGKKLRPVVQPRPRLPSHPRIPLAETEEMNIFEEDDDEHSSTALTDGSQRQENADHEPPHRGLGGALLSTVRTTLAAVYSGARGVVVRGTTSFMRRLISWGSAILQTIRMVCERTAAGIERTLDLEILMITIIFCIIYIVVNFI